MTLYRVFSASASASASSSALSSLQALIFNCDSVILESEHLHRQAYNDAFVHFNVRCPSSSSPQPLNWDIQFYDELQNQIGGGKPKMRWYFKEHGWPSSSLFKKVHFKRMYVTDDVFLLAESFSSFKE